MKDFEYYNKVDVPYPDRKAKKSQLQEEVDQQRLTAAERNEALKLNERKLADWWREHHGRYYKAQQKKLEEFWKDCRKEFAYADILTDEGCSLVESRAWESGHSHGFVNVYCDLQDLSDLVCRLQPHFKRR